MICVILRPWWRGYFNIQFKLLMLALILNLLLFCWKFSFLYFFFSLSEYFSKFIVGEVSNFLETIDNVLLDGENLDRLLSQKFIQRVYPRLIWIIIRFSRNFGIYLVLISYNRSDFLSIAVHLTQEMVLHLIKLLCNSWN